MRRRKSKLNLESSSHPHYELGSLAQGIGWYQKAIHEYKREIAQTNYYKAHYNLATILKEQRKYSEASKEFNKAVKRNPKMAEAYNNLGIIYTERKSINLAVRAFSKAIRIKRTDPTFLFNLGFAYAQAAQFHKAIDAFRKAIKIAPRNLDVLKNLGYLLIDQEISVSEGLGLLREALRRAPKDGQILAGLAVGYMKQKQFVEAKQIAAKAKQLRPKDRFVSEQVARVTRSTRRRRRG